MTVVVLGGRGFLGHHVARALAEAGLAVEVGPRREDLDLQVVGAAAIAAFLRSCGADTVVNATGRISGTAAELVWGNAEVARRLIDACRLVRPGMRLVHLGSAAEYGATPPWAAIVEDMVEHPTSPYGVAKLAATQALLDASRAGDVDAVVLRVFNPLGAGQPAATLPGSVAAQLLADPDADITVGSLEAVRDFVSTRDVARAAVAAVRAELPASSSPRQTRLINIGSGRATPLREVVSALRAGAGHRGALIERVAGGSDRSVAVAGAAADVARAARLLDWQPRDSVQDAVDDVLDGAGAVA